MAGSPEVIRLFTRIIRLFATDPTSEKDLTRQSLEITRLTKELGNVMREELYGAAPLAPEDVEFITPGKETKEAFEIWVQNRHPLEESGIRGLEALSKMDVDVVSQVTGIAPKDLARMKRMADRELALLREYDVG